jgi:altronate dehydratase small subunit
MAECFQIEESDNVATLLQDAAALEELQLRGAPHPVSLRTAEAIRAGHKVALRLIAAGEPVLKYGCPIGEATLTIQPGAWVHLHNCRSLHDAQSSRFDVHSGVRTETPYV